MIRYVDALILWSPSDRTNADGTPHALAGRVDVAERGTERADELYGGHSRKLGACYADWRAARGAERHVQLARVFTHMVLLSKIDPETANAALCEVEGWLDEVGFKTK